ncbi:right-handed parallel beta-helix repeat-containing protein [Calditrichota bacterium GD2]
MKSSFFVLFLALTLFAQTEIPDQSEVYGVWGVDGSPYLINGEAIVPLNQTLVIEAGVEVRFKTGTSHEYINPSFDLGFIRVQGALQVKGKADSLVVFTRQGSSGQWGILFFDETASDSSFLRFAKIEHASYIQYLHDWLDFNGALSMVNVALNVENCRIANNAGDGVYVKSAAIRLTNCLISDNGGHGIRLLSESDAQIYNCTIVYNGLSGFDCGLNSQPLMVNSILYGNASDLEIGKYSQLTLDHCLLQSSTLPSQVISASRNFPGKNPHFVDAQQQDYRPGPNSWAVNNGLPDSSQFYHLATDLQGNPRFIHGRIDLGALERSGDFLRLEYPIGNESLLQNSIEILRWSSNVQGVEIDYSTDAGLTWQSVASYDGSENRFEWQVPALISEDCLLRIAAQNDFQITDISDTTFIISDHTIIRPGLSVSGKWQKVGSPVEVRGPTVVEKDSTLQIEAGVQVLFKSGSNFDYSSTGFDAAFLQVQGHLQAHGVQGDTIVFTALESDRYWGGLIIEDTDSLGSVLRFVKIERAYGIDSLEGKNFPAALSVSGAKMQLEHMRITNNARNGLLVTGAGNHLIARCVIEHNERNGILFAEESKFPTPEVANNTVRFNGLHGIFVKGIFSAFIHDNLITRNDSCGVKLLSGYAVPQIVNNRIGYQKIGVFCDNAQAKLVGNVVYHNEQGLLLDNASPDIGNLTLADNTTAIRGMNTSSILTNILFAFNTSDFSFPSGDNSAPGISYSLTDKYFFAPQVTDLGFNRYGSKTNFKKQAPHYYALTAGAAAIDHGTMDNSLITLPEMDVAGKPRITDGNDDGTETIDIGAYEFALLQANFKAQPTTGKLPLKVQFTDQSKGEITAWRWDFGDGVTDSVPNPQHLYHSTGRFDVQLIVSGPAGADTLLRKDYIYGKHPPYVCQPAPDVSFFEDSDWQFVALLTKVFCDSDSVARHSFSVSTSSPHILKKVKNDSLFVKGEENFYGHGTVFLKAQDQLYLSARDTFAVFVLPVNDAPFFDKPLPDSLRFRSDSSATLNLWQYVADIETPDSLLHFDLQISNDSLLFSYDSTSGMLIISAAKSFAGQGWLRVTVKDDSLAAAQDSVRIVVYTLTDIENKVGRNVPVRFFLAQNFPNPFNPTTTIAFGLPLSQDVRLALFDVRGRKLATLLDRSMPAGVHRLVINAQQLALASGIYFVVLKTENFSAVRKLILIK